LLLIKKFLLSNWYVRKLFHGLLYSVTSRNIFANEYLDENRATCANERNRTVLNASQDSQISRGTLKFERCTSLNK